MASSSAGFNKNNNPGQYINQYNEYEERGGGGGGGLNSLRRTVSNGFRSLSAAGMMLQASQSGRATSGMGEEIFTLAGASRHDARMDDEEALRWAAIEKLPTYDRVRKAILTSVVEGGVVIQEEVDVTKLGLHDRQQLMEKILQVATEDNERLLRKLRDRIDKYVCRLS